MSHSPRRLIFSKSPPDWYPANSDRTYYNFLKAPPARASDNEIFRHSSLSTFVRRFVLYLVSRISYLSIIARVPMFLKHTQAFNTGGRSLKSNHFLICLVTTSYIKRRELYVYITMKRSKATSIPRDNVHYQRILPILLQALSTREANNPPASKFVEPPWPTPRKYVHRLHMGPAVPLEADISVTAKCCP